MVTIKLKFLNTHLFKKVTTEHTNKFKLTHNDYLDDLTLKMASSNLTKSI